MLSRKIKIAAMLCFVLFFMLISCLSAWITGYSRGMFQGKMSVYNARYRHQSSCVQSAIKGNDDFRSLTLDRYGDGSVIIRGFLTQEQIESLQQELVTCFGSSSARWAVSKITVAEE